MVDETAQGIKNEDQLGGNAESAVAPAGKPNMEVPEAATVAVEGEIDSIGHAKTGSKEEEKSEDTGNETEPESTKDDGRAAATSKLGSTPIVSANKKSRPPYKYNPDKITLRFLFANRDGLTVTVECNPTDSVGEVKGALLSVWPDDLPGCSGGDRLRLICMGKGILSPDTQSLESFQIPVFKTHPTPINVSVKPEQSKIEAAKKNADGGSTPNARRPGDSSSNNASSGTTETTSQGCACVIS